jgi:Spy/CpxP family protein refolding chaperone
MKKTVLLLTAILVAASALALAQMLPPGDPATHIQHHIAFLTKQLALTSAQQQQATTIFTNAAASHATVHDTMKATHQSLDAAIKSNDVAAIDQLSVTIGNLVAQTTATEAKARAAFYQILTPDQQAKLTEFEGHHHGPFGHEGPGGFHGHDHGPKPNQGPAE